MSTENQSTRMFINNFDFLIPFIVAAHADNFAAKRMRKVGQRRAVDYTSTVVRYIQVMVEKANLVIQPYALRDCFNFLISCNS